MLSFPLHGQLRAVTGYQLGENQDTHLVRVNQVLSLGTGVRTFAKVEVGRGEGVVSSQNCHNCNEGIIISNVGSNQATRRWQGGRPVE